jgi:hypothetical protein
MTKIQKTIMSQLTLAKDHPQPPPPPVTIVDPNIFIRAPKIPDTKK